MDGHPAPSIVRAGKAHIDPVLCAALQAALHFLNLQLFVLLILLSESVGL